MAVYKAPLKDINFVLNEVLDVSTLLRIERFEIGCSRRREHELSP